MSKKILLILAVICLVIFSGLCIYLLTSNHKINIENKNKTYQLTYKPSAFFENQLSTWNVWEEKEMTMSNSTTTYTISRIKIITLDKPSTYPPTYSHYADPQKKDLTLQSSFVIEGNTGIIYLYIKPNQITDSTKEYYEFTTVTAVLKTLYYNRNATTDTNNYLEIINQYDPKSKNNPFTLKSL